MNKVTPLKPAARVPRHAHVDRIAERYLAAREFCTKEGLSTRHVRIRVMSVFGPEGVSQKGGMTVVFRQKKGDSFLEVAAVPCSANDLYCRKIGTVLATEEFANARVMRIPNYFNEAPVDVIDALFGQFLSAEPQ